VFLTTSNTKTQIFGSFVNQVCSKVSQMFRKAALIVLVGVLLVMSTLPAAAQDARPVIIDTDMAFDDAMAILYILNHPAFSVQAITVTGTGLAYCDAGTHMALGLVELAAHDPVPVNCWREDPLVGDNGFPDAWRTDMAAAKAMGLTVSMRPSEQDAVKILGKTITDSAEPIDILALGPLTNVGAALEADPTLADNIRMITVMGGAIDVAGSGIDEENTTAEWNIYGDPHSACLVVESGAPVTLVLLDATNEAPVTPEFLNVLAEQRASPEAEYIYEGLLASTESIENGRYFFWDPLAAAVLTNPELVTLEIRDITVIDTPGPENGRTKPVGNGFKVLVATAPNSATFERHFINVINH
jgi:pyrimidine-specific ribonucleoside hydrolase